jgi:shikimate dehydrogenase
MPNSDLSHAAVPHAVVIGQPIAHSRSPLLHGHWLRTLGLPGSYQRLEVSEAELASFMRGIGQDGLVGCNVTVPHKQAVVRFLARLDPAAEAIGAVNTVWLEDGRLIGGNTDAHGFLASLDEGAPGWDRRGKFAVLLGAGGAARAAAFALLGRGMRVAVVNRSLANANALVAHFGAGVSAHPWAELQHLLPNANLLVQSTSLGMTGKPDLSLDISGLHQSATVYDMVYAPLETTLLHEARARGLIAVSGLGMLLHQAVPGFARWFGITPTVTPELRALLEADLR